MKSSKQRLRQTLQKVGSCPHKLVIECWGKLSAVSIRAHTGHSRPMGSSFPLTSLDEALVSTLSVGWGCSLAFVMALASLSRVVSWISRQYLTADCSANESFVFKSWSSPRRSDLVRFFLEVQFIAAHYLTLHFLCDLQGIPRMISVWAGNSGREGAISAGIWRGDFFELERIWKTFNFKWSEESFGRCQRRECVSCEWKW